jgi:hypothetical protein
VSGEFVSVNPDADHRLAVSRDEHVADPGYRLQLWLHHLIGVVGELASVEPGERHPQHGLRVDIEFLDDRRFGVQRQLTHRPGLRVDIELLDDRRLGVQRQLTHRPRHLVTHVLGGDVDVAIGGEHHGHLRHPLARIGGELVDALDSIDRRLDDVGDIRLHDFRRRTGQDGDDRDHGEVDGRQEVDGQRLIAEDAEDHQRQHHHDGEDRTADRDVIQVH